ncbi:hypothetical protein FHETE_9709 [Fusarium heterosporum]|uniref:Uncharacterized protein n=1 Tax=Fusarium heterosporum TaxID=42747 RepID=A0A8H5SW98_FUSHE|nr:hypothetical protein FHETE_9709 [Fusarium heterosporum]
MCRGENVQCKECYRLSTRIVELCIRGELMGTCPETIIEGVSLEKEECRLCRYSNAKGNIIMAPSVLRNANEYDRKAWRAAKEQPMPRTVPRTRRLKPRHDVNAAASKEAEEEEFHSLISQPDLFFSVADACVDVQSYSSRFHPKPTLFAQWNTEQQPGDSIRFLLGSDHGKVRDDQPSRTRNYALQQGRNNHQPCKIWTH